MVATALLSTCILSSLILLASVDQAAARYNFSNGCDFYQPSVATCPGSRVSDAGEFLGRILNGLENYALFSIPGDYITYAVDYDYIIIPSTKAEFYINAVVGFILHIFNKYYFFTTLGCQTVTLLSCPSTNPDTYPANNYGGSVQGLQLTYGQLCDGINVLSQPYQAECNIFASNGYPILETGNVVNARIDAIKPYPRQNLLNDIQSIKSRYGLNIQIIKADTGVYIKQAISSPNLPACNVQTGLADLRDVYLYGPKSAKSALSESPKYNFYCRIVSALTLTYSVPKPQPSTVTGIAIVMYERTNKYRITIYGYSTTSNFDDSLYSQVIRAGC